MNGLKLKFRLKFTEIIIVIALFLFSLRVLTWFEYPYIIVSGDLRPPLVYEAFIKHVLYTWNEIDLGVPSVYTPRILDPFYFFIIVFNMFGLSLYLSEMLTMLLIYFLASVLMYAYVKELTDSNIIVAFVATLYLTSNIFLVTDRAVTAVGFVDMALMILPCLLMFTRSIKKGSYRLMTISGLLFTLTYGTFPNYRTAVICLIMLGLNLLFIFINRGLKMGFHKKEGSHKLFGISIDVALAYTHLKLLAVFLTSILLASIWIIVIILSNFDALAATYAGTLTPPVVLNPELNPELHDIPRLIAKWSFYGGGLGKPYVPYRDIYLSNPLIILLSYLPPALAFASLFAFKQRKITIFYGGIALVSLLLTAGFSFGEYNRHLYLMLTEFPLLKAFREPANWIFFVILSYSVLIGTTVSVLCRKFNDKALQVVVLGLVATLFVSTSFPLVTGDVTRNWLDTNIKGSYFPNSYVELNNMLSNEYWTILLPQRDVYVVYNFTGGVFSCGNPYPLIFSKPIISGCGTEYLTPQDVDLIDKLYELIRMSNDNYKNIARQAKASASSVEAEGLEPSKANDGLGSGQTRWSSQVGIPQWLQIKWDKPQELSKINILFEATYAEAYQVQTWNGYNWTDQVTVENNTSLEREHIFSEPINTTRLRLYFTKSLAFGSISVWELEAYKPVRYALSLGIFGVKYAILEKNIIFGNLYPARELRMHEKKDFVLVREWDEVALFENVYSLQKLYMANNVFTYSTLEDMCTFSASSTWDILKHSAFVNATLSNELVHKTLVAPESFVWKEVSPTQYEAYVTSKGPFFLAFLENYDKHWKVYVNGEVVRETNHFQINAFANGWLIDSSGNLTIIIEYETQNYLVLSIFTSITLLVLLLVGKTGLMKITRLIYRKLKYIRGRLGKI